MHKIPYLHFIIIKLQCICMIRIVKKNAQEMHCLNFIFQFRQFKTQNNLDKNEVKKIKFFQSGAIYSRNIISLKFMYGYRLWSWYHYSVVSLFKSLVNPNSIFYKT